MKKVITLKDLVKYVIFIGIIYTLMIIIPSQKISTRDILLIVFIITIGFIFIDCLGSNPETFNNLDISNNPIQSEIQPAIQPAIQPTIIESSKSEPILKSEYVTNSLNDRDIEVEIFKKQLTNKMVDLELKLKELQSKTIDNNSMKYMNFLIDELVKYKVLNNNDIENIKAKIDSKLLTNEEVIAGLEKLKSSIKSNLIKPETIEDPTLNNIINLFTDKSKSKKSEYSVDKDLEIYKPLGNSDLNKWSDGYTILNTDKWQIPVNRPPVCINTSPCKVCPSTDDTYPVKLGEWDSSRKISNTEISKEWANKQVDPNDYFN